MHIRKKLAMGITVLFLLGVAAPYLPAAANNLEERENELGKIKQELDAQKNVTSEARKKVAGIAEQLKAIQISLEEANKEYEDAVNRLDAIEGQIENNKQMLVDLQKNLELKTTVLNKRMRDIYKNGQVNYLDVLLGAVDFVDFANRINLLRRVLTQDISLINQIKADQNMVSQIKFELEQDHTLVLQVSEEAKAKKTLIESRKKEHEKLLWSAIEERDVAERTYEELMSTSREIEKMIRRSKASPGATRGSGAMIWPVASDYITSPFGWRTHPIFGTSRFHSGVDIAADYGETVAAADNGTVIFSGWMGGYGKAVIIDHGGGISTLYAHNSSLAVSEGQSVGKGQTISYVGSTGYSTGPHLHFEVRVNGSPANPMSYY